MTEINLTENLIDEIKKRATDRVVRAMHEDLVRIVLYGSCARGDYNKDSDIDIAIFTKCDRTESKKYNAKLAEIATDMAMKYYQVVNFACLPYDEYIEKKAWYPYFANIEKEGQVLYG